MATTQDKFFLEGEGDSYFKRNAEHYQTEDIRKNDTVIDSVTRWKLNFDSVLQLGCANGSLLAAMKKNWDRPRYVGVEPSLDAIRDGQERFHGIELHQGTIADHPLDQTPFDLVIVQFVLSWVDRSCLFQSIANIDALVRDGGYLIVSDFNPNYPSKRIYGHAPEENVWSYKQSYASMFESSCCYTELESFQFCKGNKLAYDDTLEGGSRQSFTLLRKSLGELYAVE